jgi:hypothetical protein
MRYNNVTIEQQQQQQQQQQDRERICIRFNLWE